MRCDAPLHAATLLGKAPSQLQAAGLGEDLRADCSPPLAFPSVPDTPQ
jgi:hypothetical protein